MMFEVLNTGIFFMMLKSFLFLTSISLPVLEGECLQGPDPPWRWTAVTAESAGHDQSTEAVKSAGGIWTSADFPTQQ